MDSFSTEATFDLALEGEFVRWTRIAGISGNEKQTVFARHRSIKNMGLEEEQGGRQCKT